MGILFRHLTVYCNTQLPYIDMNNYHLYWCSQPFHGIHSIFLLYTHLHQNTCIRRKEIRRNNNKWILKMLELKLSIKWKTWIFIFTQLAWMAVMKTQKAFIHVLTCRVWLFNQAKLTWTVESSIMILTLTVNWTDCFICQAFIYIFTSFEVISFEKN